MKLVQRVRQSNDSNLLSASKTLVFVSVFYGFLGQMRFALPNSLTCRAWVMRVFGWWYIYIHIVCFWMYPSPTDSEVVSWSFTIMPGFPEPCLWLWTNTTNPSGSFKLMNENNRTHKDATVSQREWKVYNFNPLHTGLQKQIHAKPRKYQRLLANGILRFRICAPKSWERPKNYWTIESKYHGLWLFAQVMLMNRFLQTHSCTFLSQLPRDVQWLGRYWLLPVSKFILVYLRIKRQIGDLDIALVD